MKFQFESIIQSFFSVGPHAGAHRVALRAALCLALPLLVLYTMDRTDLALYASFGAFAAIYGRADGYSARLFMQASAGLAIVAAMIVGTSVSYLNAPNWFRVIAVAIVAYIVTMISHRMAWRPTGAMFVAFSAGACATIPAEGSSFAYVLIVGGGALLWTLAVTVILASLRVQPRVLFQISAIQPMELRFLVNAITIFVGVLASGWLGLVLFDDHWYWATIAAIATLTGANTHARLTRGVQRFLGTAVGVVFAAAVMWLDPPILVVICIAILAQGLIELIVLRNYALAMVFITVIALLMVNMASPLSTATLIKDRVLETLVGVFVGMVLTIAVQMTDIE